MQEVVPSLDQAQFERHQASLVSDILRPDKNLSERAEFYWESIARKQWDFAGRETLAAAVEAFTLESWTAYFEEVFLAERHALQVVAPGSRGVLPQGDYRVHDSAAAIKRDHATYVIE